MALLRPLIRDRVPVLNDQATGRNCDNSPHVAIGALPDELLLIIFNFCRLATVESDCRPGPWPMTWHKLVHVCQRWRYLMFSSPLSLDLCLYCTDGTAVKEMLDVWPPLPIKICSFEIEDDIMTALEHHDRVREINLHLEDSGYERLATVLQKSFPVLTAFRLATFMHPIEGPVLSDTLLGGSAPRLRSLCLKGLTFPTLPQFLLSCNDLSDLQLRDMSDISPDEMATGLSTLTRLTNLSLNFEKSGAIRCPPPLTRVLLPALTQFNFRGTSEYLDDLLVRLDTPQLEDLTAILHQHAFDIQHVISHSRRLLGPFDCARVTFRMSDVDVNLSQSERAHACKSFNLTIVEDAPGQQVPSIAQLCTRSSSLLAGITKLDVGCGGALSYYVKDNPGWLVLFRPFTAVRTLRLFGKLHWQRYIVSSLQIAEGGHTGPPGQSVTGVLLPELQHLYLIQGDWREELEEETMELFVTARQQSDRPVTIHRLPYHCD